LKPTDSWPQIYVATRYFAYGRYDAPDRVLKLPEPDRKLLYLHAMWRYARGEASARKGDVKGVLAEARAMALSSASEIGSMPRLDEEQGRLLLIARKVLEGRAAMLQGRWDHAAQAYAAASSVQETKFSYSWDPPAWWYPVRRSLAEAELRAGRLDQAEADARTVLKTWPDDPLTERVLAEVDQARGRDGAARLQKAKSRWKGDLEAIRPAEL
jgi:hypothetical protein